jgi:hypothetical protein
MQIFAAGHGTLLPVRGPSKRPRRSQSLNPLRHMHLPLDSGAPAIVGWHDAPVGVKLGCFRGTEYYRPRTQGSIHHSRYFPCE